MNQHKNSESAEVEVKKIATETARGKMMLSLAESLQLTA